VSIGETLAEARRQTGLTIAQVGQRTRIRESMIRAIEQDDFSPCGGDFYARGHIRSIADVVGIDPAPLIREYDEAHPPAAISAGEAFEPMTPIKIRQPRRFPLGVVALVVIVLCAAGGGAYELVSGHGDSRSTASSAATFTPAVTAPPKSAPSTPAATPAPTATKAAVPEAVIVLAATQACWVEMKNSSGQQVFRGTIAAGKTKTWAEKHKVSMVIGNPPGIKLTVDGKNVTPNTAQVVTLNIDPQGKTPVQLAAASAPGVTLGAASGTAATTSGTTASGTTASGVMSGTPSH
jgi:cytoskeletal protein RodZ